MTNLAHSPDFSTQILTWWQTHGRHDLAWQQHHKAQKDPYPVWVSEIMLQQTQVATVIGYFDRFMHEFPTLRDLANAPLDKVLENWAGLGYYARAKNLHKTAKALQQTLEKTDNYPQTLDDWQALSGIGRSTAGAIMAMGLGKFGVICDGNVKRVLTRHFGIADDITRPSTDKVLWQIATDLTPEQNSGHYAQAMMDIGATLCTRTRPACTRCPVADTCIAFKAGNPTDYPVKAKKSPKPTQQSDVILLQFNQASLWLQREVDGIWANLWCLPVLSKTLPNSFVESQLEELLGQLLGNLDKSPSTQIRHTLTHFHWQLRLLKLEVDENIFNKINELLTSCHAKFAWQPIDNPPKAIPTAMKKLLKS